LYAEFGFEGALIASNTVDGAAIGISVTNFNEGGRLAVVQGNLVRNLLPRRPGGTDPGDGAGIGIYVEADSAVSGNVVENAPTAGSHTTGALARNERQLEICFEAPFREPLFRS